MKTLTQVILPIGIFAGLIYFLTIVSQRTNPTKEVVKTETPVVNSNRVPGEPPLRFAYLEARFNPEDRVLKHFQTDWEIDQQGHFDFWFWNPHHEQVNVYLDSKSCTCTGASIAAIPDPMLTNYLHAACLNALPLSPFPLLPLALETTKMMNSLQWETFDLNQQSQTYVIPGSLPNHRQFGIFRMTWKRKALNDTQNPFTTIRSKLTLQLPNTSGVNRDLSAVIRVLPSVHAMVVGSPNPVLDIGDVQPNQKIVKEIVCFSTTRRELELKTTLFPQDSSDSASCIQVLTPVKMSEKEIQDWSRSEKDVPFEKLIRCAYRLQVIISENRETEENGKKKLIRMDMGPFEKYLQITQFGGGELDKQVLRIFGVVRGEIAVLGGIDERDVINLGKSITPSIGAFKRVEISTVNTNLELSIVPNLTVPEFVTAKLDAPKIVGSKKRWILSVTLPPGKLFGNLPLRSGITLQTNDSPPKKIRIPIQGNAASDI